MLSLYGLYQKELYEAASLAGFPATGVAARLYIADDTDNVYRWSETLQEYRLIGGSGSGGTSDHGALTGLADDDHPQYLTQTRADARYAIQGEAGTGVTDHGVLTGLADDDHPHYFNQLRGDARYSLGTHGHAVATASVDGFMSAALYNKLAGIAAGATANATDAQLRDRGTHSGTQAIATIAGLQAALDAKRATGLIGLNELAAGGATNGQVLKFDSTSGQWLPGTDLVGSGGGGGAVDSVFGRIGAVVAASGDYTWAMIGSKPTTRAGFGLTDAAPLAHVGAAGVAEHAVATSLVAGFMAAADKAKLDGIPSNATANATDADLRSRATHTGTQAISTVSGLQAALDAKQVNLQVQDEGANLGTAGTVTELDFTGQGVTATRASNKVTVNIPITNDPSKAPIAPTVEDIPIDATYTLVSADNGKIKYAIDTDAQTVVVPTGMPTPFAVQIVWPAGSGTVTLDAATGVNINGAGDGVNVVLAQTGGAVFLVKRGATENYIAVGAIGDLAVADITDMSANARSFNQAANYAAMVDLLGGGASTGTGVLVRSTNPIFTTPNLGTPSAATLTNAIGLPVATGISGLGAGVAALLATFSSANLRAALGDETGSGGAVFATAPTLSGATNVLDALPINDDSYQGITIAGRNAGEALAQWDAVYLGSGGTWLLADANGTGTFPARGLVVAATASASPAIVLSQGVARNDAWAWTAGADVYLSGTPGGLTQTAPSTSGDKVQKIGYALSAVSILVDIGQAEYLTVA